MWVGTLFEDFVKCFFPHLLMVLDSMQLCLQSGDGESFLEFLCVVRVSQNSMLEFDGEDCTDPGIFCGRFD